MEAAGAFTLVSVRAVLGPTNTGKTHLAVERLLAHGTGMIGLPLRLLAREIYDRMVRQKGERACALVTGEERIIPAGARYYSCTVEAMPVSEGADFIAIDEIQLATDPDRGHVFTDRVLNARGRHETMLLGADTMRPVLHALNLNIDTERRERFSKLSYAGPIKITKLPKRSAVVAFSAEEVYAIAELLKRQRGGCAVIMGALSPRTRNAQVDLFQSGEVDYIVATDAIGMGLNLDVGHVAFASRRKFDGRRRRLLRADEAAQIAGRAGRFRDDGSFGETGDCEPFEFEMVEQITEHRFEPAETLNWRNHDLNWSSLDSLRRSLRRTPPHTVLRRAPDALDEITLAVMAEDPEIRSKIRSHEHVRRLWDLCTLPDFRKSGPDAHVKLVGSLIERLVEPSARLKDEWVHAQVDRLNQTQGDIDTLQQRLSSIRTWTYAANRSDWIENAETWRRRTREIEDRLSDALHERLMQRFVDRRTSALLKSLSSTYDEPAEIGPDGAVMVLGHAVGRLEGLRFSANVSGTGGGQSLEGRALRGAAVKALRPILEQRLRAIATAEQPEIELDLQSAELRHLHQPVARLIPKADWLSPDIELLGGGTAAEGLVERATERLRLWTNDFLQTRLKSLFLLRDALNASSLSGPARGFIFRLSEAGAALDRRDDISISVSAPSHDIDTTLLASMGIKVGRLSVWMPDLLKQSAIQSLIMLKTLQERTPIRPAPVAASFSLKPRSAETRTWSKELLASIGYLRIGDRAVRADMCERLYIELSKARRSAGTSAFAPPASLPSLIGCPANEFPAILRGLGLTPARRGTDGRTIELWRFSAKGESRGGRSKDKPSPTAGGAFAALAVLIETPQPPVSGPRRKTARRGRRPS
jgi:ATP-dependent RNA helicase SUPV3L1/SUV3